MCVETHACGSRACQTGNSLALYYLFLVQCTPLYFDVVCPVVSMRTEIEHCKKGSPKADMISRPGDGRGGLKSKARQDIARTESGMSHL